MTLSHIYLRLALAFLITFEFLNKIDTSIIEKWKSEERNDSRDKECDKSAVVLYLKHVVYASS